MDLKKNLIDRVRLTSILDGVSYILLLGIAMPLKYGYDMPIAVKIAGPIHGVLFLALCFCLLYALLEGKLTFSWCVIVFICALIPFAPFFLDRKLKGLNSQVSSTSRSPRNDGEVSSQ
ncbi:MAG: DUF3817 domain-containing protein [Verrucomicrobiales bacterium]|nr:DUF3817 domain-containing protein [Verrucomicrobiales bacterium]